jgi:RimJ/RimL family protein N-acetyltransferase
MRSRAIAPPHEPLSDGVIEVRMRQASDLDAIAEASYDAATMRWLGDPPLDASRRATSLDRVEEAFRSGGAAPLVIAEAPTGKAVGLVNLQFRSDERASIAYSVFPNRRGHGIAGRAVDLVARWAFDELEVQELQLELDPENAPSIRVAHKCHFMPVGHAAGKPEYLRFVRRGGSG